MTTSGPQGKALSAAMICLRFFQTRVLLFPPGPLLECLREEMKENKYVSHFRLKKKHIMLYQSHLFFLQRSILAGVIKERSYQ